MRLLHIFVFTIFPFFLNSQELTINDRVALLNAHGYSVTNTTGLDERLYKKKLAENSIENKKTLILGSSRVMKIDSEVLGTNSVLNLSVSTAALEDIMALYYIYRINGFNPQKVYIGIDFEVFVENSDTRFRKAYQDEYNVFEKTILTSSQLKDTIASTDSLILKQHKNIISKLYHDSLYTYSRCDFTNAFPLDSLFDVVNSETQISKRKRIKDTIKVLNKTVKNSSFYEMLKDSQNLYLNSTGNNLVFETEKYRKVKFKKLEAYQKNNIMKLNRTLLELCYGFPTSELSEEFPTSGQYSLTSIKVKDGSHVYAKTFEEADSITVKKKASSQVNQTYYLRRNQTLECRKKKLFESFINHLISDSIQVVLVLPPCHHVIYNKFMHKDEFHFPIELESYLKDFSKKNNTELVGTYNPNAAGFTNEDFLDGLHLSKKGIVKILHQSQSSCTH